jgi:hypothetical protein
MDWNMEGHASAQDWRLKLNGLQPAGRPHGITAMLRVNEFAALIHLYPPFMIHDGIAHDPGGARVRVNLLLSSDPP